MRNRAEKQIMPSKITINWLFDDIWRYLFIACFDWKIGVFHQTVVRVYHILDSYSVYLPLFESPEGTNYSFFVGDRYPQNFGTFIPDKDNQ